MALRIYPSLPEYTPLFVISVFESQNLPSLPEYTPLFNQFICVTLPESTPPSQNIPPFQQMYICDPPRIYLSVPEYTPFFTNYMRPSQNLPLPEYTPLFNKCICATLPQYTPPSQNIPPFQQLCATLPESTPPS